jgi:predicted nucleotidyltransferase
MMNRDKLFSEIKNTINKIDPNAEIVIYGSYARGTHNENSDLDVLILVDNDKINLKLENKLSYPLYDLEFETGQIISPLILSKNDWKNKHKITPFYENIIHEGITL